MTLSGYVLVGHGYPGCGLPGDQRHFIGMFELVLIVGSIIDRIGCTLALVSWEGCLCWASRF